MESTPQEDAEGQAIVHVLAVVLERLVSANSHLAASQQEETKFHALRAPAIGILQYLERIHKYASCSKECFILALIYIDRLIQRNNFLLTELNVHRVVITAVLLAAKFFDDAYYNNAYYAKVGGVLVSEMNTLECEFLFKIDFSLRVIPDVFEKYNAELISHSSALGLNRISTCTDEELFRRVSTRQQQDQAVPTTAQHYPHQPSATMAPQAQAPVLRTYSQTEELEPVMYPIPTPAAPQDGSAASHYPMQALHHSMMAALSSQTQVAQQQQQQQHTAAVDPVYPFPAFAHEVSVQQHAQAPPAQNPIELDLIYQPPASQECQYSSQALHHGMAIAPQAQVYTQQAEPDPMYHNTLMDEYSVAQAPVYSQQANYYTHGTAAAQTTTRQPSMLQSYPEITPSPPPQPPINHRNGVPMGHVGCSSHVNLANSVAYLNSTTAATMHGHHHQHHYATSTDAALDLHHQQLLPSRPIAINHHSSQDNNSSWPFMFSDARGPT